ncbi:MAG: class A beta-lactamase-related serine hydrolase [Bacteroidetes bacterium]|nr:MAG: class A beta-lactamase-related serine hydrolase [Bacteroidota bacterium]
MKPLYFLSMALPFLANGQTRDVPIISNLVDAPAVYYAIVSADSVLYKYARGFRSIREQYPIDTQSQFALFSITKTFTAAAILQLQQLGKLQLDDPVSAYLPQYPFLGSITIRQLLAHQSGLNNPMPVRWVHLEEEDPGFDYRAFSTQTLRTHARVRYKPGRKAAYSNLNYLLLGEVIEAVSGQPYQAYILKHVLKGNAGIGFKWSADRAVTGYHSAGFSGLILGFLLDKKKYTEPRQGKLIPFKRTCLNGAAYGGLLASPTGLEQYLRELLRPQNGILSDQSKTDMFTEQPLANGEPSGYALGWHTGQLEGRKYVHHAGGGGGFYLELRIYPELGVASYVLTNKSGFSDKRLLDRLDGWYWER